MVLLRDLPVTSREEFWWKVGAQRETLITLVTKEGGAQQVVFSGWDGVSPPHGHWAKVETEAGTQPHLTFHHAGNEHRMVTHSLQKLPTLPVYVGITYESCGVVMYQCVCQTQ